MADDLRSLPPPEPRGEPTTIELDGEQVRAFAGEPVAVALFASGVRLLSRSPKYHRPRGLFCASGHCASCLMRIDGRPNQRACLVPSRPGLRCERQNAFPDAEIDLLRAADWLFPKGMDHHRLMTGSRLGNQLFVKLVRQMGGTGTLPDEAPETLPPPSDVAVDVCIVGAGPAGLAAATAIAARRPQVRLLVVDDQDRPGGSLLAEPGGLPLAARRAEQATTAATSAGGQLELWPSATALAYYPEERVLAVRRASGLARVTARRFLYTTGSYDQNLPVEDNDRPGILSARAVGRLAFRFGIRPGRHVYLLRPVDQTSEAEAHLTAYLGKLAQGLRALGVPVSEHQPGALPRVDLDQEVIAAGSLPAPASELPRQHGAQVRFDPSAGGFRVVAGDDGRCAEEVYAAGDITGYQGPESAARDGARVGAAVADSLG
jgi:sarcosine oxidase subunit alpha